MKVLILTKYSRMGASSRLRTLQYIPYLESQGYRCTVQSLFDDQYLHSLYTHSHRSPWAIFMRYLKRLIALSGCFRYDLIWVEYEIFPYLPAFAERLLRLMGKAYVVDYDDAVFHNYDLSSNWLVRQLLGRKIDVVMRNSACVVAGNSYLVERARAAYAPCVEQVPTVVDQTRYRQRETGAKQPMVIGWIGSPATQHFLLGVREGISRACQAQGARLLLVGATVQVADAFPDVDVEIAIWSEDCEVELIKRMDVGIMPLSDGPWEKGKCGYKLIQYMACGIPVIASPVGANVALVSGSQCGLLANSDAEWEGALLQLLQAPEQREALGNAGRKSVEETYSLQRNLPLLAEVIRSCVAGVRPPRG